MDSVDIGLLALSLMILAVVSGVWALSRKFSRDEIFVGPVPGQVPGRGQQHEVARVSPGREYSGEVAVQFQPPKGLTPGLVGTIVDGKADMHDVTATLVDLAVRDYLKISSVGGTEEPDELPRRGRRPKAKDWTIKKVNEPGSRPGEKPLHVFEARLLDELFRDGDEVLMSQLGNRFGHSMRAAQDDLYRAVQDLGWYRKHPSTGGGCLGGLAVGASVVLGLLFMAAGASVFSVVSGLVVMGSGWVLMKAARRRTPRTALGTAAYVQTLGFKKYLETAEADQIKFEEAAEIFSRYLPYAIVFGVADHWAEVFGEVAARAREMGYEVPMALDWFDGLYMGMVVADLLDGVGGLGMLDLVGELDLVELAGGAVDGIAGLAEGVGDFIDGFDFDF